MAGLRRVGRVTQEQAEQGAREVGAVARFVAAVVGNWAWRDAQGRLVALWAPGTGEFRAVATA